MSRRHRRNAQARRGDLVHTTRSGEGFDIPMFVERRDFEQEHLGKSYEEARWAYLSPTFRAAHNRLRIARGMEPLPPPLIDHYKPPPPTQLVPWDPNNAEWRAARLAYERGVGSEGQMMGGIGEGFEVKDGIGDVRRVERK